MADEIIKKLLQIPAPEKEPLENLIHALTQIENYEQNKDNALLIEIRRYLQKLGVPDNILPKHLGILIQSWIDSRLYSEHKAPESLTGTTSTNLVDKIEAFEKRDSQIKQTRENSDKIIDNAIKRKKEIQEELNKTRLAESEIKGKRLYASVKVNDQTKLNENEEAIVARLRVDTIDADKRTIEIERLSKEFEQQLSIKNEKEREVIARAAIVGIIAQVHNPNLDHKINSEILKKIASSSALSALIGNTDVLELIKKGSIALSLNENAQQAISRQAAVFLYGNNVSTYLFGPGTIEIEVSINPQSDSSHVVDLGRLNTNHQILLENQFKLLDQLSQSKDPINTVYSNIILRIKDDESKIIPPKTKKPSEVEKISELVKRVTTKKVKKDIRFDDIEVNTWIAGVLPENSNVHVLTEKTTGQGIASTAVLILTQQLGTKAVGTLATKGILAKVLPKLFATGGPLAWLGAEVVSWLSQWLIKNKDKIPYILGGAVGLAALPFLGIGTALLVGGTTFVIVGGVGATSLIASSFFGGLNLFWRLIVLPSLIGFFYGFLTITILTVFVLVIINNSAYVVPPSPYSSSLNGGADNPYMLVTKTANPTKLDNSNSNQTVIYVVSIKALKGNLTNLKLVSTECNVIKKDKSKVECPTEFVPELDGKSVTPGSDGVFSFTGIYGPKYSDSLIYDRITISATNEAGEEITTSGSASVCIGECPANCAVVSDNADNWSTSKLAQNVNIAIGMLSQYQGFTAKLCPNNEPINLCYRPSEINPGNYAWHVSNYYGDNCDIYFNSKGIGSEKDALFMVTHELTHHIQAISSEHELSYSVSGAWIPEIVGKGLCTYNATKGVSLEAMREGMAEAAALYVNSSPSWDACAANYSSKYPKNYVWAKKFMEE